MFKQQCSKFEKQLLCIFVLLVGYFMIIFIIHSTYIPHFNITSQFESSKNMDKLSKINELNGNEKYTYKYPIKTKNWGDIYDPIRIFCLVPTLIPENNKNINAILNTWGITCDKLFFIINIDITYDTIIEENKVHINDEFGYNYNYTILKIPIKYEQSKKERNIWEKMWKTWEYMGNNYINYGEYFLKIDDDSFFSGINFKGYARYYNPDLYWYMGHTLLHKWKRDNVVFNSGTTYALSRGSLKKVSKIFSSKSFLNALPNIANQTLQGIYCVPRKGPLEDQSMGVCMRSIGIQPTNTLDNSFRQRFHMFKDTDMLKVIHEDTWFWKYKPTNIGVNNNCCSPNSINFHAYKYGDIYNDFLILHKKYNINEGIKNKTFEIPYINNSTNITEYLYKYTNIDFNIDSFRNKIDPPIGQYIYKGINNERQCFKCEFAHLVH